MSMRIVVALVLVGLVSHAEAAMADQDVSERPRTVRVRTVVDNHRHWEMGRLESFDEESLTIVVPGQKKPVRIVRATADRIDSLSGRSHLRGLVQGTAYGFGICGLVGAGLGAAGGWKGSRDDFALLVGLRLGLIGAAVGGTIGGVFGIDQWQPLELGKAGLSLGPALGHGGVGANVTLKF